HDSGSRADPDVAADDDRQELAGLLIHGDIETIESVLPVATLDRNPRTDHDVVTDLDFRDPAHGADRDARTDARVSRLERGEPFDHEVFTASGERAAIPIAPYPDAEGAWRQRQQPR